MHIDGRHMHRKNTHPMQRERSWGTYELLISTRALAGSVHYWLASWSKTAIRCLTHLAVLPRCFDVVVAMAAIVSEHLLAFDFAPVAEQKGGIKML